MGSVWIKIFSKFLSKHSPFIHSRATPYFGTFTKYVFPALFNNLLSINHGL